MKTACRRFHTNLCFLQYQPRSTWWWLPALLTVLAPVSGHAETSPPAISIEFRIDRSDMLIPNLRMQYQQCVNTKRMYQTIRQQGIAWAAASRDLPAGYQVNGAADPEPDWAKRAVGIHREQEFFFGDKYAHISFMKEYSFSEDGHCRLQEKESVSMEKDNGTYRYQITLSDRIPASALPGSGNVPLYQQYRKRGIRRHESQIVIRNKAAGALSALRGDPALATAINRLLADPSTSRTPGTTPHASRRGVDSLSNSFQISVDRWSPPNPLPRGNDKHLVLGQPCDIISSGSLAERNWYWHRMHYYPGPLERPIILKSEVNFGGNTSIKEATKFKVSTTLDPVLFEPAPDLLKQLGSQ